MTTLGAPNMMDYLKVCSQPLPDEVEQYREMTGNEWYVDDVANDLFSRDGLKWVILDNDNEPLAVFGGDLLLPGVWQTWMISTATAWDQHGRAVTRHSRKVLDLMFDEGNARRIQTIAMVSRTQACKWYENGLRMTQESVAKGFGVTGQDFACYVRFKEQ